MTCEVEIKNWNLKQQSNFEGDIFRKGADERKRIRIIFAHDDDDDERKEDESCVDLFVSSTS